MGRVLRPVSHHEPVVGEHLDAARAERVPLDIHAVGQRLVTAHRGVAHRREAVHRRRGLPFVFVVRRARGEVAGVLESDQLAERVVGRNDLHLTLVELTGHSENIHRHGFGRRREGLAVADDDREIPLPRTGGAEGVAVHGGIVVRDRDKVADAAGDRGRGIYDVLPRNHGVFVKRLHHGRQPVDSGVPSRLVRIGAGTKRLDGGQIGAREQVELYVFFAGRLVLEFTLEHQAALRAEVRIQVEPVRQVRRQVREVGLALVGLGIHAAGKLGQALAGKGLQRETLLAGRIVEDDGGIVCPIARGERDGLLVKHESAALSADRRASLARDGEGFTEGQCGRCARPDRAIGDRLGGCRGGIPPAGVGPASQRAQVGHDRSGRRRARIVWPGETFLGAVEEPHGQGIRGGGRLRKMRRPTHEPVQRQRSLRRLGGAEGETDRRL